MVQCVLTLFGTGQALFKEYAFFTVVNECSLYSLHPFTPPPSHLPRWYWCRYANRAKNIQNNARINEDPKDALLREFQKEIELLRKRLEECDSSSESEVEGGRSPSRHKSRSTGELRSSHAGHRQS